jgi:hypothetical protein
MEPPRVAARPEADREDAVARRRPDLAVRARLAERAEGRTARPDDELPDAGGGVRGAARILR